MRKLINASHCDKFCPDASAACSDILKSLAVARCMNNKNRPKETKQLFFFIVI